MPVVSDSFLGGFAPRLRNLTLVTIPFPRLPKLLLSATLLVGLTLHDIPRSGYFSPDVMVNALSTLTSLQGLTLEFQSPRSCPDQASRRPPPSIRSVLPILRYFAFKGVTEYLEDLVACIDAPRLNSLHIIFFNVIVSDTTQLMQFISRTPTSRALKNAYITLSDDGASLNFSSRRSGDGISYVISLCQGLASFISEAGLYLVPASPFYVGGPLHLRPPTIATTLESRHRERGMAGTITPLYRRGESLPIRGNCTTHRVCPARACWEQNDGGVARPAEYFLEGARAIGTCPGRHWTVRCLATGRQLFYSSFPLGRLGLRAGRSSKF